MTLILTLKSGSHAKVLEPQEDPKSQKKKKTVDEEGTHKTKPMYVQTELLNISICTKPHDLLRVETCAYSSYI